MSCSDKGRKMRLIENRILTRMFGTMKEKVTGEERKNVEGYRRTISVGKTTKHHHDISLFILGFEWEMGWACIAGGRNKARENLHERVSFRSSR
jgi:hypothetical protein